MGGDWGAPTPPLGFGLPALAPGTAPTRSGPDAFARSRAAISRCRDLSWKAFLQGPPENRRRASATGICGRSAEAAFPSYKTISPIAYVAHRSVALL